MQAGAIKAANKKVLGEVNTNIRIIAAKDDSDIGKASPGKISSIPEPTKPAATFARPATRPLALKSNSSQNVVTTIVSNASMSKPQPVVHAHTQLDLVVKKIVPKKSTKVLREAPQPVQLLAPQSGPELDLLHPIDTASCLPVATLQLIPAVQSRSLPLVPQHQEVRKTESIPLRDEPAQKLQSKQISAPVTAFPPGFTSEQEYMQYLETTNQYQHQNGVALNQQAQYLLQEQQPIVEQFYDVDEDEYYEDGYTTARSFGLRGESTGGVTTVLAPKYTDKVQIELNHAKAYVDATRTPEDIEDEQWDTSMVAEYGDEIFAYMHELEVRMSPNPHYMEQQQEIQWSMRAVLIDWVIQVHQRFNLLPETLFLTVNYIDRFLSCKVVSLGKLQLVGATAIFVAAKYEEVQCPTISEIIYMVDGGYSAEELLKAERFMLSMLQFELGWPGPMSFLRRISKADDYDLETRTLAKYFLEVTIMDERFVGCTPSFLAAGAHCMARLMLQKGEWSPAHVFYSNYTYSQLRQLLSAMLECCEEPQKHHAAVFEKYVDKRYKRASTFVAGEIQRGFQLPAIQTRGSSSLGQLESMRLAACAAY